MAVAINIKGTRDGLLIAVEGSQGTAAAGYEELLQALTLELEAKREFLRGSRVVLVLGERLLNRVQLTAVQQLMSASGLDLWAVLTERAATREIARELGLATRLPGSNTDLEGNKLAGGREAENIPLGSEQMASASGLLLKETIRSGRHIFHEGHVVIIGDVNPGAQIVAGSDVIVWGKLRGLVHAGAMGDATAVICALELIPTQLRIADQIAISPDERRARLLPEMAVVRNGRITAEPWPK
jgi:septum site-determining protein MinC